MQYLAHISEDGQRKQTLEEHNNNVAELAKEFAEVFDAGSWGYCAGKLHDIGKATAEFLERLNGGPRVDHSTAGAQELDKAGGLHALLAYCVAGHHAGLPDKGSAADSSANKTLVGRLRKKVPDYHAYMNNIKIPDIESPSVKPIGTGGFTVSFFLRMIYSCLVDADFLDTENFMTGGITERLPGKVTPGLWDSFTEYIAPWMNSTHTDTVNGRRTEILKAAIGKGLGQPGVYTMTVPTGGGKTVSSLGFALQQAITYGKDRIIYVIPYTSIIEQNAQVFRDILGSENVLEDHYNVQYKENEEFRPMQLAAENWDKPVIVTTNVQFFESLFSNRSSKCRKLHNIANSVIIFDEAQKLPNQYLLPCVRAMEELVTNYKSTLILCTATQPALQKFFVTDLDIKEICPRVEDQFNFFKRTNVENIGSLSELMLIERIAVENQTLCILNNRKRAQKIYSELAGDGVYHLSTLMYPKHRERTLAEIRQRLDNQQKCIVIATSLVEAGVDFDFQIVYRELAGIDSLVQAAGRCNREGKRPLEESYTYIFTFEEKAYMPAEIQLPIGIAKNVVDEFSDISSLEAINSYFRQLHYVKGNLLDQKNIIGQFEQNDFPFATVEKQFRLIEQETRLVIIQKEAKAEELVKRLRFGEHSKELFRELGRYGVQVYEQDFEQLYGAGCLDVVDGWDDQAAILKDLGKYSDEIGLVLDVSLGNAIVW